MSNAALYYYPDSKGTLETIDLGGPLQELEEIPLRQVGQGRAMWGYSTTYVYGGSMRVRVVREYSGYASPTLDRALMTLSAHLERGGLVGVTADQSKAWASVVGRGTVNRGDTGLFVKGNLWYTRGAGAVLASGDEVVLESSNPELYREFTTINAWDTLLPTITPAARYTFSGTVHVRWRNFYPALFWPADQRSRPIVTSRNGRVTHTLDVTLEMDWSAMEAAAVSSTALVEGTTSAGVSLEGLRGSTWSESQYNTRRIAIPTRQTTSVKRYTG